MNPSSKLLSIILFFPLMALGWPSSGSIIAYLDADIVLYELSIKDGVKKDLVLYKDSLQKELEVMQAELEEYYHWCMKRARGGCMSLKEEMEMQKRLEKKESKLRAQAVLAKQKVMEREVDLLKPVRKKCFDTIAKVAQRKGYAYVIDKKHLLYYNQGISIDNEVRKELGLSLISVDEVTTTPTSPMLIAYVNQDSILLQMESYKKAKAEVWAYGDSLKTELENLQQEAEAFYKKIRACDNTCCRADKERIEPELKLQQMQANLQQKAEEADQKLAKREEILVQPVYKELHEALASIAEERGYHYIMDKKQLLYDNGGTDATARVLAYLAKE